MGDWGPGNFQDDTSSDHLVLFIKPLVEQIEATSNDPAAMEPDEYEGIAMICNVEILACLGEHLGRHNGEPPPKGVVVGFTVPEPKVIERWRTQYLAVWDAKIDELAPKPEYKTKRRAIIEKTFDRLSKVAALARQ
jgi:hypothetical protein